MSNPPTLYYTKISAACRSVLMTAKLLGLELDLKPLDLSKGQQLEPEFLEMNPQHTVPTLDDNGFFLAESRAILCYLVDQYGSNDELYPKDVKERAIVHQRLYFDMTVYQRFADYYYPVVWEGATELDVKAKEKLDDVLEIVAAVVTKTPYVAGTRLTVADISLLATMTTLEAVDPEILDKFPEIKSWMDTCKTDVPDFQDANQDGAEELAAIVRKALVKISDAEA